MSFPYAAHQELLDWLKEKIKDSLRSKLQRGKKVEIGDMGGGDLSFTRFVLIPALSELEDEIPGLKHLVSIKSYDREHPYLGRDYAGHDFLQLPVVLRRANLSEEIPFEGLFDSVNVNFLLSYLGEEGQEKFMKLLREKLGPEGRALFVLHASNSPLVGFFENLGERMRQASEAISSLEEQKQEFLDELSPEVEQELEDLKKVARFLAEEEWAFDGEERETLSALGEKVFNWPLFYAEENPGQIRPGLSALKKWLSENPDIFKGNYHEGLDKAVDRLLSLEEFSATPSLAEKLKKYAKIHDALRTYMGGKLTREMFFHGPRGVLENSGTGQVLLGYVKGIFEKDGPVFRQFRPFDSPEHVQRFLDRHGLEVVEGPRAFDIDTWIGGEPLMGRRACIGVVAKKKSPASERPVL